ncbi:unnamed protein product [Rotaria sp. Silwood2]|nr:unnamed protein product [Rotaria sp. Silwood2]
MKPWHRIFVGVINPIDPIVETPEQVCARVLEAAKYIPAEQLGTTDDCGFSPFDDDQSTSRQIAFDKIRARVERRGTMYRGKKTVRRGGGNSQVRGQNTTKTRPMTRQQSVLLCEKDQTKENDEKFALVE